MKRRRHKAGVSLLQVLAIVMALSGTGGLLYDHSRLPENSGKTESSPSKEAIQNVHRTWPMLFATAGIGMTCALLFLAALRQQRRQAQLRYF